MFNFSLNVVFLSFLDIMIFHTSKHFPTSPFDFILENHWFFLKKNPFSLFQTNRTAHACPRNSQLVCWILSFSFFGPWKSLLIFPLSLQKETRKRKCQAAPRLIFGNSTTKQSPRMWAWFAIIFFSFLKNVFFHFWSDINLSTSTQPVFAEMKLQLASGKADLHKLEKY